MALEIQGKTPEGGTLTARSTKDACLAVQLGHSNYQEAVLRGNVYGGCSQAGVTSQAGLSGTTPTLVLYNPTSSTTPATYLVLWYAGAIYTVAFATAGAIWLGVHVQTAAAQAVVTALGTANILAQNMLLGSNKKPIGQLLLASTASAPVGQCLLAAGVTGAITAAMTYPPAGRWFDGTVVLGPNTAVSIQTGVASGAAGQFCEFIWEEVAF